MGLDPSRYAGHSFRSGGCTWAFLANVLTELLQAHGDWHSSAYIVLPFFSTEQRLIVTRSMADKLEL